MALFVYALCAVTSLICFGLLLRQYLRTRSPLTLHSSIAFLCIATTNVLLFVDLIILPELDLKIWRNLATFIGVLILLLAVTKEPGNNR